MAFRRNDDAVDRGKYGETNEEYLTHQRRWFQEMEGEPPADVDVDAVDDEEEDE